MIKSAFFIEEIPVIPFALANSFNSATVFPLKSSFALGVAFLGAAFLAAGAFAFSAFAFSAFAFGAAFFAPPLAEIPSMRISVNA